MDKLYLDTSIPSAFYDTSKPMRQLITQKWFEHEADKFELFISVIVLEELIKLSNEQKRKDIESLILESNCNVLPLSEQAEELSDIYMQLGAIPKSEPLDALHIAVATLNDITFLASWNFKHIVSINPIRKIHEINRKRNLELIEIGSLELFGGAKYGNL